MLSEQTINQLLGYQRNEITEHHIYRRLALIQRSGQNRRVLERIADDEKRHYEQWKSYTRQDIQPDWARVRWFCWISRILGLTFGVKLMERGEAGAQKAYGALPLAVDSAQAIMRDEGEHEEALLGMLDEERLLIIALFNYYISIAREQPFGKRFAEMAGLSLSVAALSFLVGYALRAWLGVDA